MATDNNKVDFTFLDDDKASIAEKFKLLHIAHHGSTDTSPTNVFLDSGTTLAPVFLDFFTAKIGANDADGGKTRLGFEVADYFEKKNQLDNTLVYFSGHAGAGKTVSLSCLYDTGSLLAESSGFDFRSVCCIPSLPDATPSVELTNAANPLFVEKESALRADLLSPSELALESYPRYSSLFDFSTEAQMDFDSIWEQIREDEDLMDFIVKKIKKRYRDIRKAYFKYFRLQVFYQKDRTDFAQRYKYLDLKTTDKEFLKLDSSNTNFKNQAVNSHKNSPYHGIIQKINKKTKAA